jgi:hypothetical protein
MTDLPTLKLKSLVNFPANTYGGVGLDVAYANGAYTINIDYSEFNPISNIPSTDIPNLYVLLWNALTNIYELAPITLVGQVYTLGNTVVLTAPGPYPVGANDSVIAVNQTVPAPMVLNLPLAFNKKVPVHISDTAMNAGVNNITINPTSPETINGLPSWTIAGNGGGITLYPLPNVGYTT